MKISFLAIQPRPMHFEPVEADPAAERARQRCILELILDDPALTPAEANALCRQAEAEAASHGLRGRGSR